MSNNESQTITILLGSQSALKIQAVENAFSKESRKTGSSAQIKVIPIKAASEVNEQPFGFEETQRGARNRLANTKKEAGNIAAQFVATIENGIIPFQTSNDSKPTYIDMPYVLIEDMKSGKQFFTTGCGLPVPAEYVEEAQRRGFDKCHVGMILCEKYGEKCSKNDPHSFVTAERVNRVEMMEQVRTTYGHGFLPPFFYFPFLRGGLAILIPQALQCCIGQLRFSEQTAN